MTLRFEVLASDGAARMGRLTLRHGVVETPAFMPVGTYGTVKAMTPEELARLGAQIVLGNTFHLMLRPGTKVIAAHGDLHRFMNWQRPILTDSGGFQVFSLAKLRRINEEGVRFRSPINGSEVHITPEISMDVQRVLGSDIVMAFDDCTAYPATHEAARLSMERSMRWAARCRDHYVREGAPGALFGIVQGGMYDDLRRVSLEALLALELPGLAVGGLAVGEPEPQRLRVLEALVPHMPTHQPRYLMGVGRPEDIVQAVLRGIDMFDCVMPTRNGRNGMLFTREGVVQIKNKVWADDHSPLDPNGTSFVDSAYSKAFVRHLFVTNELLGLQIASLHNLAFYVALMTEARGKILDGTFSEWKAGMLPKLKTRISG